MCNATGRKARRRGDEAGRRQRPHLPRSGGGPTLSDRATRSTTPRRRPPPRGNGGAPGCDSVRKGRAVRAHRAAAAAPAPSKKGPLPKYKGRDAISAARPFFHSGIAFHNPGFFYCPFRVTGGRFKTVERFVLPQTLRRPAPNLLAAASFWHIIASLNFWPCHEARRLCHAYFFWLGPIWSNVHRRVQKCWAVDHLVAHRAPFYRLPGCRKEPRPMLQLLESK